MNKSVAVPDELYHKATELAARDHVSVEEFAPAALASRLASREYRAEFERALDQIPDVEPDEQGRR